jgi:chaperone modulatory protein CbpM
LTTERHRTRVIAGAVLDDSLWYSMEELCRVRGVSAELVVGMVDEGILEPIGTDAARWRFSARMLARLNLALRLRDDLGLNLAGSALAIDLIDEVRRLRARVGTLEAAIIEERR